MEKTYTPHKSPKTIIRNTTAQSFFRGTPESHITGSELAMLKDYESLKIKVRHLQNKNHTLISQVEHLLEEKRLDDQIIPEAHKGKSYQIQMLIIKQQEEMSRMKRQYQLRVEELIREIKHKDYQIRQKDEESRYMQLKNQQLVKQIQSLQIQLSKCRQQLSQSTATVSDNQFTIKKLQMFIEQQQLRKTQIQSQIRALLDIEAQKSLVLNNMEIQLKGSQDNQKKLNDKLNILTQHFAELQGHINAMKQKLITTEQSYHITAQKLDAAELTIISKQTSLLQQQQIQNQLLLKFEESQRRLSQRQRQIKQLMSENERLYKDLSINRHRLHEFGAAYGVQV